MDIKEILERHQLWLDGEDGGERADFTGVNLKRCDFSHANLENAIFSGANLSCAHFTKANLEGAIFRDANCCFADFSRANLFDVDFQGANLWSALFVRANLKKSNLSGAKINSSNFEHADISDTFLWFCWGNGREIKSLNVFSGFLVSYTAERIQIGCKNYLIEEWRQFSDEEIKSMSIHALDFWRKNKDLIFRIIEEQPATPTMRTEESE